MASGVLAACAPTITHNTDHSQLKKPELADVLDQQSVQSLTADSNWTNLNDLEFSPNFYKQSNYEPIHGLIEAFHGFDADIDLDYLLNSAAYQKIIAELSAESIRNDILDNLKFLAFSKPHLNIDFKGLKLDFQLEKVSEHQLLLKNFLFSFELVNRSKTLADLFNSITIAPNSRAQISIRAAELEVKPWYKNTNTSEGGVSNYFSSWKLTDPKNLMDINVNYVKRFIYEGAEQTPIQEEIATASTPTDAQLQSSTGAVNTLEILPYRSFALNTYYTRVRENYDFQSLHNAAMKKISGLTGQQLKDDLTNDAINFRRIYYSNLSSDINNILKYFITPNIRGNDGINYSLLDLLYKNKAKAANDALLSNFNIPGALKDVLSNVFSVQENESLPPLEQIYAFIQALLNNNLASYVYHNLDIEVTWIKDPEIDLTNPNIPKVSMEYTEKITFKKELNFPLKGTVKYKDQEITYDVSKLFDLGRILKGFGFSFGGSNAFDGIVSTLINDLQLDDLKIPAGTYISTNYKADKGNLLFYMPKTFDVKMASNYTFGWQVDQVKSTTDLSGFYGVVIPILEKLNQYELGADNTSILGLISLNSVISKLRKGDLKSLLQALTFFFLPYQPRPQKNQSTESESNSNNPKIDRPVETLVKNLLKIPLVFTNSQISAMVSQAFYELPQTINKVPLYSNLGSNPQHFIINSDLNLEGLVALAPTSEVANSNTDYKHPQKLQLIWKDAAEKLQADGYNYFLSDHSTIIQNDNRDKEYDEIINTIQTNDDVNDELIQKLKDVAKKYYENPVNSNVEPEISITKVPLFEAFNNLLNQPLSANNIINNSPTIKNLITSIISTIVSLDPYIITTTYSLNSNQFGEHKDGKYSSEIDMRKSTYMKFISPKIDFGKLSFPSVSQILKELGSSLFSIFK
ncbi:hypothetical protein J2Z62_000313 [Mycoplasmoides fastidiosum]|uniref:Lipoprotein n=1 Tax=Mycoplasmoides fastidiosum TaxID=92758 RepID=A0ABU0LYU7_9BACT|nr:hypothetical protein [Mycoplasmoides fastidiosum]MDQ0513875.1 hypothetical protein [Mycoplasmoides fastidiosum]UUD37711.1 hypothetical protein NPA10_04040 [Mycoplasmoides fastidiosum]